MSKSHLRIVERTDAPADYPRPFRFIPSVTPPTRMERFTDWMRGKTFGVAVACYVVATVVGCYFAFQMGRGL